MNLKMRFRPPFYRSIPGLSSLVCLLIMLLTHSAQAAVTGLCSSCHTMHYSQDGGAFPEWGDSGPYEALLTSGCASCHMGVNTGGPIPFVFSSMEPIYGVSGATADSNTLAGGNFYWVAQAGGDAYGHNVAGLVAGDGTLTQPPGFVGSQAAADGSVPGGGSWPAGQQVTCAGVYGCHGSHSSGSMTTAIRGGHHQGVSGALGTPGTSPAEGFRMLVGIAGYEDSDWEFHPTVSAHNQYKGEPGGTNNSTISSLCARCHGNFHSEVTSDSWLRHPVDYDMGSTATDSEYRDYGGESINAYRPDVPVASTNVSVPLAKVTFSGDTIVACISCHRAHGSPYDKMIRWDYAGSIGGGCAACHTSKD